MNNFGDVLRKLREVARLRLKDVAEQMGWSVVYQSDIERGRRNPPVRARLIELAKILNDRGGQLIEAASQAAQRIELPMVENQKANEVGLMLARKWDTLTDDELNNLWAIFNKSSKGDSDNNGQ